MTMRLKPFMRERLVYAAMRTDDPIYNGTTILGVYSDSVDALAALNTEYVRLRATLPHDTFIAFHDAELWDVLLHVETTIYYERMVDGQ